MIQVRALGPLEVTVDGNPAPSDLLWRHNIALLLYLARAPARRCTREQAIGLLWPDKPQASARQSLREAVRLLRRYVGEAHLRAEADQLELAAGAVELDTDRFDRLIEKRDWAGATPLVRGKFAEGFGLDEASAFEDWLRGEQWHWYGREMDVLIQHAEQRLDAGDLLGADDPARRAVHLDPESQRALRTLMRRLALAGDRSAALERYDQFARRAQESGATIEPETRALAERLRRAREWKLPPAAYAPEHGVAWRRVPLFGRERELAEILTHWRQSRAGRLGLVMIEAAPGGGKTRLAEEVMARATLDGGVCIATRAVPADQEQSMSGIAALTRGGLLDAPGVAAAAAPALAVIARQSSEWAERFPVAAATSSATSLGAAVIDVLRAVSVEQPVLLVLDDAQWLDDASLGVLETMVRDLGKAPILVLVAATAEPTTPKLAELRSRVGRDASGSALRLPVFDDRALEALVRWAFPQYTDEQVSRLSRRIAADSAGIPLLAMEICHAITQGLDVDSKSGVWPRPLKTLDDTMPGDLPETIAGAIRVGFNALSPTAAAALKATAVLGERVSAKRIGRALGIEGAPLDAALDELEWRRWLVADPRGYSFVARIVREVVERDMVLEGERQRIRNA
jgi:DNA-binding SARP family transcriptional activator